MYLPRISITLIDKSDFCKLQALKYKFAEDKSADHSPDEKIALLPL